MAKESTQTVWSWVFAIIHDQNLWIYKVTNMWLLLAVPYLLARMPMKECCNCFKQVFEFWCWWLCHSPAIMVCCSVQCSACHAGLVHIQWCLETVKGESFLIKNIYKIRVKYVLCWSIPCSNMSLACMCLTGTDWHGQHLKPLYQDLLHTHQHPSAFILI